MSSNGIIRMFICFAAAFGAMLVSCRRTSFEEPVPGPGTQTDDVRVSFRIALQSSNGTRAGGTPEGSYDDGTQDEYENRIDLQNGNYRFYFFDAQNRYLSEFQTVELIPDGNESARSKTYEVVGKTDKLLPANFKVVALANWPSYPAKMEAGVTTIEDLCSAETSRYTFSAPFAWSPERLIPMYGVKSCEEISFTSGMLTHLGTLHLLRAVAKVEVTCKTSGWTIEGVELVRYNETGYCAPSGVYSQEDYVKGNYDGDYVDDIHLPDGKNDEVSKTRTFVRTADGRFIAYVPEYRNVVAGTANRKAADAAEMHVRFKETPGKEYTVEFKYYNDPPAGSAVGAPFDIRRNYYYKFSISKTSEPDLVVEVFPYELVELDPGFGLLPKTDD